MKNLVICTELNEACFAELSKLDQRISLADTNIHMIYCRKLEPYIYDFAGAYYPSEEQTQSLIASMQEHLESEATKLEEKLNLESGKIGVQVLSAASPKDRILSFIKENNADMIAAVTSEKNGLAGLFHSSFTNYMNAHAPCDVLVLRSK